MTRGRERYGVLVRSPRELRDDPERITSALVATPAGARVALGQLARIGVTKGATLIKSETAQLNGVVYVNVRDRDVGSYVHEARQTLAGRLSPGVIRGAVRDAGPR